MGKVRGEALSRNAWGKTRLVVGVMLLTAAVAACGGDEEETAAVQAPQNPPANPPAGNQPPTISGTPGQQAMQSQQYAFTPTASDPNGDSLTFTVANAPSWTTFNGSTGRLSGTPSAALAGQVFSNIRISVSDGTTTVNLPAFSITVVATATGSAMLTWTPPTQNTDGSPLNNLAGYRLYWGTSQTSYTGSATINNAGLTSYVVDQLTPATWYFAITAVNSAGVESAPSNIASKRVL